MIIVNNLVVIKDLLVSLNLFIDQGQKYIGVLMQIAINECYFT